MAFIDLGKAFDSVNRESLYIVLGKLGCLQQLLLHKGMMAIVVYVNEESETFAIIGVKQGCDLAPVFFNVYFPHVRRNVLQGNDEGVYLITRYYGGLFEISRLRSNQSSTK